MAEETSATMTEAKIYQMAEEAPITQEESAPNERSDAPDEEEAKETTTAEETTESDSLAPDQKRKLEDLEKEVGEKETTKVDLEPAEKSVDIEPKESSHVIDDAKRQKVDVDADRTGVDGVQEVNVDPTTLGNSQRPLSENTNFWSAEIPQNSEVFFQQGTLPSAGQEASRKIEVLNNKVGVLIGKAGDTIRNLQRNSGARIQITRDAQADPNSSGRPVELIGTLEQINKAEQLIKDVIAEADAGGSPALIAQGYGTTQFGAEVHEMQVPNEKVGMIIGKGGETIKSLQTTSGARIQLIPQHLPEGDVSKERTVRVTGTKKQIEAAKEMIKEVMNKVPIRPSPLSTGHSQNYRPRGPTPGTQWGPRGPPPVQNQPQPTTTGYDYQQRGVYPQPTQYPPQPYSGGYPQQPPPRSNHSTSWEQRPGAPMQNPPTGGYNYYGQTMGTQPPNPAPANYGHPQAAGYGQTNPYPQSGPTQQNYGPGYNEPKYDNQAPPTHQVYGQQQPPASSQPGAGFYPQQGSVAPQPGYSQQQAYSKPAPYSGGGAPPQSYGPQAPPSYGSAAPAYTQTYGPPPSGSVDGYSQPPPAGYSQPGGYPQSAGYGQYASAQPSYGEPPASSNNVNVNYAYQGGPGYTAPTNAGYGATPAVSNQPGYPQAAGGYAQPAASYDQSAATQYGYGGQPGTAAAPAAGGYGGGWTA